MRDGGINPSVVTDPICILVKYTKDGSITVQCRTFGEPEGLRAPKQTAVEIIVADSGCGIPSDKLESIFREFEQVESFVPRTPSSAGLGMAAQRHRFLISSLFNILGLGLAVVARIVEQLGGQLRVDSKVNQGSQFSFLIPLALPSNGQEISSPSGSRHSGGSSVYINSSRGSGRNSVTGSAGSDIDSLVEALQSNHMASPKIMAASPNDGLAERSSPIGRSPSAGQVEVVDSANAIRPVKVELDGPDLVTRRPAAASIPPVPLGQAESTPSIVAQSNPASMVVNSSLDFPKLRVLIVEVRRCYFTCMSHALMHISNRIMTSIARFLPSA